MQKTDDGKWVCTVFYFGYIAYEAIWQKWNAAMKKKLGAPEAQVFPLAAQIPSLCPNDSSGESTPEPPSVRATYALFGRAKARPMRSAED